MATYYNPGLLKSHPASNGNSNRGSGADPALAAMIKNRQNAIAQNERNSKTNWNLRQTALNETNTDLQSLLTAGGEKGLDTETLIASTKEIMKNYANAKIRLAQATGKYPGYESDEALVRNTKSMIANIGDTFGSLRYTVEGYNEAMKNGPGPGQGQVDMGSVDTRFMAMNEIAKPGSNIKGKVSFEAEYDEENGFTWYQVAKGESIKAANEAMGIEGDTYRLSYKANESFLNEDRSQYNNLTYNTNPVIIDDASKTTLQDTGVYNDENAIHKKYDVLGKVTKGNTVYNTNEVNVRDLYNDVSVAALAKVYDIADGTDAIVHASMRSNIKNGIEEEVIDGVNQYIYYKPSFREDGTLKRDLEGNPYKDPSNKVILGNDQIGGGHYIRNNIAANGTRGFTPEDYEEFVEYIKFQTLWETGALRKKEMKVDASATKLLRKEISDRSKAWGDKKDDMHIETLIRETSSGIKEMIEAGNFEGAVNVAQDLTGLKAGWTIETPDSSNASFIEIYGPSTVTGKTALKWKGDITSKQGLQNLFNLYGVKKIIPNLDSGKTPTGVTENQKLQEEKDYKYDVKAYTESIDPDNNFRERPTGEEGFINSFLKSDQYNLKKLGVKLDYANNFKNEVTATDSKGESLGAFDPKTKAGKAKWKAIVEKQLSKGEEPVEKPEVPPAPGPKPGNAGQFNPPK